MWWRRGSFTDLYKEERKLNKFRLEISSNDECGSYIGMKKIML